MKQYNPDIYHRHSIRLKGYDYSQEGLYFITECCEYVIMPNHFHAIIKIDRDAFRAGEPRPYVVTLGHIVGYFKYQSTKMINLHGQKLWQRNYYEHIIRDEKAYHNISNYILNNPAQWAYDRLR